MRFYKRCLQILDLTEITKNELKESFQDVLRIGITSSNGGLIQQDNIKHFIEHYDHVQYRIYEVLLMKYLIYYCLIILI